MFQQLDSPAFSSIAKGFYSLSICLLSGEDSLQSDPLFLANPVMLEGLIILEDVLLGLF